MPLENPKRADGPLIILNGNLAPDGAVAKVSGVKVRRTLGQPRSLTLKKMLSKLSCQMKSLMATLSLFRFVGPRVVLVCLRCSHSHNDCW